MSLMNRKRVLVVDDHFELAELLSAALENEGLEAVVACSGQEALREARVSPPDLAIVDLGLPDMLGTELLEALA
ncbi:MAG: response regulator, partial [Myxococcota bacterium]